MPSHSPRRSPTVTAQNKKASQTGAGAAVMAGVAGAAAGAALGVALADKKNREKLLKMATEARDAVERLMTNLRSSVEEAEMQAPVKRLQSRARKAVKKLQKG